MHEVDWYPQYKSFIETSITITLTEYLNAQMTPALENFRDVILYALQGGKKLRAILALETYLTLTGKSLNDISYDDDITKVCVATECMHAYSLVHDDLPCIDNDTLRRGEPTVWKKYGESQAVFVGDFLNSFCFECISNISNSQKSQEVIKIISHAVGFYGMVGGQVEDLYYESHASELTPDILEHLHAKKTGKLIEASLVSGVILAGAPEKREIFETFGKKLGLAFQIKDDLLDVEGTPEQTGKSVGGEQKGFVHLYGVETSRKMLHALIGQCQSIADEIGSEKLQYLVDYVATRKK